MKVRFNKYLLFSVVVSLGILFAGMFLENKFKLFGKIHRVGYKVRKVTSIFKGHTKKSISDFVDRGLSGVISDFESENDLNLWEKDPVEFERTKDFVSQGDYSLRIKFKPGNSPGLASLYGAREEDWSSFKYLKFDIYNEYDDEMDLVFILKGKDNYTYSKRFDGRYVLKSGWNHVAIDLQKTIMNDRSGKLPLRQIIQYVFALTNVKSSVYLYLDNIRLEKENDSSLNAKEMLLDIDASKDLKRINPLIFGAHLSDKTTDEVSVKDFAKDIGISLFRFTGGADNYHWKKELRSALPNRSIYFPLISYDTAAAYSKAVGADMVVQVNIQGTPEEAADWVTYTNKTLKFYVKYWEIGNEPYGGWDPAHQKVEEYAEVLKRFSSVMKKADPSIKIGAAWAGAFYKEWDKDVLEIAGDDIDFVSKHWYPNHTSSRQKVGGKEHPDPRDIVANAFKVPELVARMNKLVKKHAPQRQGKIEFAILEWDGAWDAPWYDPPPYEQGVMQWSLANALFYAESFAQFIKEDVALATCFDFQETPYGLIRGHLLEDTRNNVMWDQKTIRPKALAIKMFRKHFGDILLESEMKNSPSYIKQPDWYDVSYSGEVPYISSYASKSSDGKKLYIMLINRHPERALPVKISLKGFEHKKEVVESVLTGPHITSQNDGNPGSVDIRQRTFSISGNDFEYGCPEHSVVSLELTREED